MSNQTFIKTYVSADHKKSLSDTAKRANLSLSELCKRVLTGIKLPSPERFEAVNAIVKVNADLARLGNLLKLTLDDKRGDSAKINNLVENIARDRQRLKTLLDTTKDRRKT